MRTDSSLKKRRIDECSSQSCLRKRKDEKPQVSMQNYHSRILRSFKFGTVLLGDLCHKFMCQLLYNSIVLQIQELTYTSCLFAITMGQYRLFSTEVITYCLVSKIKFSWKKKKRTVTIVNLFFNSFS